MSNQHQLEMTQIGILRLAAELGVTTHAQLISQNIIHPKRLSGHIDRLLDAAYLDELPARRYYALSTGRASPVYRLTEGGAEWLREKGYKGARPSRLRNQGAVSHALAMLDCRLVLAPEVASVATDKSIPYGASVIRPDNLITFRDGRAPILVESEGLASGQGSRKRIREKVKHLTDFFLSDVGQGYDSDVRIIYLWRQSEHAHALELWQEACFRERRSRNLPSLPFRPLFLAHADFLRYGHLAAERYESLAAGSVEATSEARRLYNVPLAPAQTAAPTPRAAPALTATPALLDEATLTFLRTFCEMNAEPIRDTQTYSALLALVHAFLVSRGDTLCERLGQALAALAHPTSHVAAGYAMEHAAMLLLSNLGIPSLATDVESYNRPVAVSAVGDGRSRPTIAVKVNPVLAEYLLVGWEGSGDELEKTLTALFQAMFGACRDLDIIPPKENKGKRRDYFD